jgi:uncharacterized membrane protein
MEATLKKSKQLLKMVYLFFGIMLVSFVLAFIFSYINNIAFSVAAVVFIIAKVLLVVSIIYFEIYTLVKIFKIKADKQGNHSGATKTMLIYIVAGLIPVIELIGELYFWAVYVFNCAV